MILQRGAREPNREGLRLTLGKPPSAQRKAAISNSMSRSESAGMSMILLAMLGMMSVSISISLGFGSAGWFGFALLLVRCWLVDAKRKWVWKEEGKSCSREVQSEVYMGSQSRPKSPCPVKANGGAAQTSSRASNARALRQPLGIQGLRAGRPYGEEYFYYSPAAKLPYITRRGFPSGMKLLYISSSCGQPSLCGDPTDPCPTDSLPSTVIP